MLLRCCSNLLIFHILSFTAAQKSDPENWDYLMFARVWPEAVCRIANKAGKIVCNVPRDYADWTIHGMWPSLIGEKEGPEFCNKTAKFDRKALAPIETQLEQQWPNLIPQEGVASLWKHEWTKHGTCTLTFPPMSGELKYFSKTLQLDQKFDLVKFLAKGGVTQSETNIYTASQIRKVLKNVFSTDVLIHCLPISKPKVYLADIRVCLSRDFQAIDCTTNVLDATNRVDDAHHMDSDEEEGRVFAPILPTLEPCADDAKIIFPVHGGGGGGKQRDNATKRESKKHLNEL